ncbi:MAG: hypothetical protein ACM3XQ_08130 [Nocardioidaceae bacterium]
MTDLPPGLQPPHEPRRPGVVSAAAVVTLVGATGTAASTLLLTVGLLWVAAPVLDAFDSGSGDPRWPVLGAAAVVLALSAAADVVAAFVLRGHSWAQWVLVGLSVVAALGGLMMAYYIVPLVVTIAAVAVVVLLLLPESRRWFRAGQTPDRVPAQ